jgi:inositol-phosphate phosphatase / L-galactose 1-phosphate phosphatase / histidinol-phosphatase
LFDAEDGKAFARLKAQCRYITYGSDCYGYALVALGFLDLVLESGLKSYDWGALVPVLEGAGAIVTDWDGKQPELGVTSKILVAGDPVLHAAALKLIA